jgi:uncharacterized membrane protein YoaK (UPF0700 family)
VNGGGDREGAQGVRTVPFMLSVALVGIAGWVDAVGYLQLGHLFLSFMSGNTTQMAVNLGQGQWSEAGSIGALIALFVLGVFGGTLVAAAARRRPLSVVLGVEACLLGTALLLPAPAAELPAAAFPVVLAMGVQNAAIPRVARTKVGLTYVTGTLVGLGRGLAEAVSGCGKRWDWCPALLLWLAMTAGASAGAACYSRIGFRSLAIPAVVVLALAVGRCHDSLCSLASPPVR